MADESKAGTRDAAGSKPGFQAFDPAAIEPYIVKDPEALTAEVVALVASQSAPLISLADPAAGQDYRFWTMAPANRALPLRVCKARSTSVRAPRLSGREAHWRKAPPKTGNSSAASSSKIGKRSGSMTSIASISSSISAGATKTGSAASAAPPACSRKGTERAGAT